MGHTCAIAPPLCTTPCLSSAPTHPYKKNLWSKMRAAPHQPLSSLLPLAPAGGGGLDSDSDIRSFLHLMCGRSEYQNRNHLRANNANLGERMCILTTQLNTSRKRQLPTLATTTSNSNLRTCNPNTHYVDSKSPTLRKQQAKALQASVAGIAARHPGWEIEIKMTQNLHGNYRTHLKQLTK